MALKLYSAQICPFAQRVLIQLEEKTVDYQLEEVDLGNKPEWFHEISPLGKVPVLQHGERVLFESTVINEYVEEMFPKPRQLSQDSYLKALMRSWITYCSGSFAPPFYKLMLSSSQEEREEWKGKLQAQFYILENAVLGQYSQEGPYFFGKTLSLVDIAYFPFFARLPVVSFFHGIGIPNDCEKLHRWLEAMRQRPSIQKTTETDSYYIKAYGERYSLERLKI